jgi:hypothetical protein
MLMGKTGVVNPRRLAPVISGRTVAAVVVTKVKKKGTSSHPSSSHGRRGDSYSIVTAHTEPSDRFSNFEERFFEWFCNS